MFWYVIMVLFIKIIKGPWNGELAVMSIENLEFLSLGTKYFMRKLLIM